VFEALLPFAAEARGNWGTIPVLEKCWNWNPNSAEPKSDLEMANSRLLLFPSHPLRARRPDPHFDAAFETATSLGLDVGLLDHDLVEKGSSRDAVKASWVEREVIYRGWMIDPFRYGEFERAICGVGASLLISAEQYRRAHELPNWYSLFADVTPASRWTTNSDLGELNALVEGMRGPVILKDYVKSAKHDWERACFVPEVSNAGALQSVARAFLEHRGEFFSGGFVVRAFEEFVGPEVRTWWLDGELIATTPHPDEPSAIVPNFDLARVAERIALLNCRFTTCDLVLNADGRTRVVEVGDGQVSDWPEGVDDSELLSALCRAQ
jgi:ATP-grasp domain, R2K clade family 3